MGAGVGFEVVDGVVDGVGAGVGFEVVGGVGVGGGLEVPQKEHPPHK